MCGEKWIPAFEVVAKGPGKKGTTKTRRHKVFFLGLSELRSAGKKSLPLCLRVFVVQGFLPFATLSFAGMTVVVCGVGMGFNASVRVRDRHSVGLRMSYDNVGRSRRVTRGPPPLHRFRVTCPEWAIIGCYSNVTALPVKVALDRLWI